MLKQTKIIVILLTMIDLLTGMIVILLVSGKGVY